MHTPRHIQDVTWFVYAGDGRPFLTARYGERQITVHLPKRVFLDEDLLIVDGLDEDDYDEGELVLDDGTIYTYDVHMRLIRSPPLAIEIRAMLDAYLDERVSSIDDPRFTMVGSTAAQR